MRLIAAAAFLVCGSAWAELSMDYIFDPVDDDTRLAVHRLQSGQTEGS